MGGEYWTVTNPTQTVVSYGSTPVAAVLELDDGRMVGISDEWPFYNAGSGSADIGYGDNEQLVENVWAWLADFGL